MTPALREPRWRDCKRYICKVRVLEPVEWCSDTCQRISEGAERSSGPEPRLSWLEAPAVTS